MIWSYGTSIGNTLGATDLAGNNATQVIHNRYLATFGPLTYFRGNLTIDYANAVLAARNFGSTPPAYAHTWNVAANSTLSVPGIAQAWYGANSSGGAPSVADQGRPGRVAHHGERRGQCL